MKARSGVLAALAITLAPIACGSRSALEIRSALEDTAVDVSRFDAPTIDVSTIDTSVADVPIADIPAADVSRVDVPVATDTPPPPDGCTVPRPVAIWRAEGDTRDSAGMHHATAQGTLAYGPGRVGSAFVVDGAGALAFVPANRDFALPVALTVSAWVAPDRDTTTFAPIVSRWDDVGAERRGYALTVTANLAARWDVSHDSTFAPIVPTDGVAASPNNAVLVARNTVPIGRFTHVAGTFDGARALAQLWIDGVLTRTVDTPFRTLFDPREPVLIGAGELGGSLRSHFTGRLDEVAIFGQALSAEHIRALAAGAWRGARAGGLRGLRRCPNTPFDPRVVEEAGMYAAKPGRYATTVPPLDRTAWPRAHQTLGSRLAAISFAGVIAIGGGSWTAPGPQIALAQRSRPSARLPARSPCADPVVFADPAVEESLRATLRRPTGPIHAADLVGPASLHVLGRGRPTLEDVRCLPDLTEIQFAFLEQEHFRSGDQHIRANRLAQSAMDLAPVAGRTRLRVLRVANVQVTNLAPISSLTALTMLDLPRTALGEEFMTANSDGAHGLPGRHAISDLSALARLTNLIELRITHGHIGSVSALSAMTALTTLDLGYNDIVDARPIAALRGLIDVDLSHNGIVDLAPLSGLPALRRLWIRGNPLNCAAQAATIAALRGRGVAVDSECP